ncbi:uncharacterized protein MYCFIDRAFT_77191 [Pseudocercospora fijiensis CIRAD86]|uniref:Uncharacterized protein n=1 Tax=Pseudocercospora fijiensis (strain CIRAD86) TaxID=383855 RepID=M3AQX3_PSEFD|nr:uncharacterized protein MYCFIDRAFT_77191 [Pseudocercospora fijiensis CIRAD86]EME87026.1 hypothetical protein MYCFIDRAFT_77191 [Pseudocercospora fijiensis CIRAD86]
MSDVQQALAQLDFHARMEYVPIDAGINDSVLDAINRAEDASLHGDLVALEVAMLELSTLHGAENYLKAPGRSLHFAIEHQHAEAVTFLLSRKVKIVEEHIKIATYTQNTEILEILLTYGWAINSKMVVSDYNLTLWFLDHGADPNTVCDLDLTPLSVAVQSAPMDVIKLLFSRGGSISFGQLLHYAARRDMQDQDEVVQLILDKKPPINNVMYQGLECYFLQRAFGLGTPLHEAVERGKLDIARILLDYGANPLIRDSLGKTARDRAMKLQTEVRDAMIELLDSYAAFASDESPQFTDDRRATGWG